MSTFDVTFKNSQAEKSLFVTANNSTEVEQIAWVIAPLLYDNAPLIASSTKVEVRLATYDSVTFCQALGQHHIWCAKDVQILADHCRELWSTNVFSGAAANV